MSEFQKGEVRLTTEIKYDKGIELVFMHLHCPKPNKQIILDSRECLQQLKDHYHEKGHLVVFGLTDDPQSLRLWGLIEGCYELTNIRGNQWLGSWLTGEI